MDSNNKNDIFYFWLKLLNWNSQIETFKVNFVFNT